MTEKDDLLLTPVQLYKMYKSRKLKIPENIEKFDFKNIRELIFEDEKPNQ